MNKLPGTFAAMVLLTVYSLAVAEDEIETKCRNMAKNQSISSEKVGDYIKRCVKRDAMKHKKAATSTNVTAPPNDISAHPPNDMSPGVPSSPTTANPHPNDIQNMTPLTSPFPAIPTPPVSTP